MTPLTVIQDNYTTEHASLCNSRYICMSNFEHTACNCIALPLIIPACCNQWNDVIIWQIVHSNSQIFKKTYYHNYASLAHAVTMTPPAHVDL